MVLDEERIDLIQNLKKMDTFKSSPPFLVAIFAYKCKGYDSSRASPARLEKNLLSLQNIVQLCDFVRVFPEAFRSKFWLRIPEYVEVNGTIHTY